MTVQSTDTTTRYAEAAIEPDEKVNPVTAEILEALAPRVRDGDR